MRGQVLLLLLLIFPLIPSPIVAQTSIKRDLALHGVETETGYDIIVLSTLKEGTEKYRFYLVKLDFDGNVVHFKDFFETELPNHLIDIYRYSNGDFLLVFDEFDLSGPAYIHNTRIIRISSVGEVLWNQIGLFDSDSIWKILEPELDQPRILGFTMNGNVEIFNIQEDENFALEYTWNLSNRILGDIVFFDNHYLIFDYELTEQGMYMFKELYAYNNGSNVGVYSFETVSTRPIVANSIEDGYVMIFDDLTDDSIYIYRHPAFIIEGEIIEIPSDDIIESPLSAIGTSDGIILWGFGSSYIDYFFVFIRNTGLVESPIGIETQTQSEVRDIQMKKLIPAHGGGLALGSYGPSGTYDDDVYLIKLSSTGEVEWDIIFSIPWESSEEYKIIFYPLTGIIMLLALLNGRKRNQNFH